MFDSRYKDGHHDVSQMGGTEANTVCGDVEIATKTNIVCVNCLLPIYRLYKLIQVVSG